MLRTDDRCLGGADQVAHVVFDASKPVENIREQPLDSTQPLESSLCFHRHSWVLMYLILPAEAWERTYHLLSFKDSDGLACKCLKMVARDGIAQHYAFLTIPITGIYLNSAA